MVDRLKTIDELLVEVGEDKFQNLSTTSFKFKRDLWEYFTNLEGSDLMNAVEFGTHKGQTTRILSFLFRKVYSINLPKHFSEAERLNSDRDNIEFKGMDLYQTSVEENFTHDPVNVFFIDAVHEFDAIMTDFARCMNFKHNPKFPLYFVFDDYGQPDRKVWQAVNQLIMVGRLEKIKYIGHEPRHSFGGHPERVIQDWEGIICKLKS